MTDLASERRRMATVLVNEGALKSPWLRAAVETVPRERFLHPGVFLDEGRTWRPVTAADTDPDDWLKIAYSVDTLTTQLDGHLAADQAGEPVVGVPTSSSTDPATVVGMIETLDLARGHRVLEIGTGTGYSTALMCHYLGEDNVTTVEVDTQVATRADVALEAAGFSTWTVTGDGLLGHPYRAPYDRVIATCAVHRIPYAWIRQTRPGGVVLGTVGSWPWGTGLARLTVGDDGAAEGSIVGRSSFMQARAQAVAPVAGDLSARTAYADSERPALMSPTVLEEWMPASWHSWPRPALSSSARWTVTGRPCCTCSIRRRSRSPSSSPTARAGPFARAARWPCGTTWSVLSSPGRTPGHRGSTPYGSV
ncbi:ATP-grasp peptide maturase system methyltransferase [Streptomyces hydrogenans]|uniref:ATP-grasp peptide maturase system methyltransferase n=1 Tax=Streptomyces hydrogenans TaxID=1873719 RepID=UPI0033D28E68